MQKKSKPYSTLVYSTNPDFKLEMEEDENIEIILPQDQKIKVRLEKKHRGGKTVTLIENYKASENDKLELGKKLKTFCGTGGSVKDDEILVQGDNRDKVLQWLLKNGFTNSKKIG